MSEQRPNVEYELRDLKDFQRRTVDRVHERLWSETDPSHRFLVADEVGLGKTMVARGVIAKTIDHLWDSEAVSRIDVVYICSNGQIARQNLPKLRVGISPDELERHHADRLTLLATQLRDLESRKVNFVSFTPDTSFKISDSGGHSGERVLLYWLLKRAWPSEVRSGPWTRFFQGGSGLASFKRQVNAFDTEQLTAELGREFAASLSTLVGPGGDPLANELRVCVDGFRRIQGKPGHDLSRRRYRLIGRMRQALARTAVTRLEPDLVILDEFQRFKDLMSDEGEGSELARALFEYPNVRLLLLSATPFKMYTLPEEPEGDDHYRDFVDTVRFLSGPDRAASLQADLATLRAGLYAGDADRARGARDRAQAELRRVMSRTERLATTPDRDGLVVERTLPIRLAPGDVRDFRRLQATSAVVGGQDPLEYWRSAPYVLELMESYQVKQKLLDHDPTDPALVTALSESEGLLRWSDIQRYVQVDPGNAKMRGLTADVLDRGAWQLAWIPPSLPYYELGGPYAEPSLRRFTKRLIFSSWAVAPKAIGSIVSYEAERRIAEHASKGSSATAWSQYDAPRPTGLLNFQRTAEGRLTGMPAFGLLYPSVALGEAGDPLAIAGALGQSLPAPWEEFEAEVRRRVELLLKTLPTGPGTGIEDASWYWAAAVLLDRRRDLDLVGTLPYGLEDDPDDTTQSRFYDHLEEAASLDQARLGRRPDDLVEVVVRQAIGGLGNVALRAISRVAGGRAAVADPEIRRAASCVAWSLRNMFNRPEIMGIVRGSDGEGAYWLDVLHHCVHGGIQSVLDEYVHVINETKRLDDPVRTAQAIARELDAATSLRTAVHTFTDIEARSGRVRLTSHRTRTHFAVRFGRGVAEDDKSVMREVRSGLPSTHRSGRSCSRPPRLVRRGSTSTTTAMRSSTGTSPATRLISSSAKVACIVTRATRCAGMSPPRTCPGPRLSWPTTHGPKCSGWPLRSAQRGSMSSTPLGYRRSRAVRASSVTCPPCR